MTIKTLKFGNIEIDEEKIISFSDGIIGFTLAKRYILLDLSKNSPFKWLQAVDEPSPCFLIIDAALVISDYKLPISKEELIYLQASKVEDLGAVVIVTVPDDPHKMTVNIKGPIVINFETRVARQIVLTEDNYSSSYPIFHDTESLNVA